MKLTIGYQKVRLMYSNMYRMWKLLSRKQLTSYQEFCLVFWFYSAQHIGGRNCLKFQEKGLEDGNGNLGDLLHDSVQDWEICLFSLPENCQKELEDVE